MCKDFQEIIIKKKTLVKEEYKYYNLSFVQYTALRRKIRL